MWFGAAASARLPSVSMDASGYAKRLVIGVEEGALVGWLCESS